MIIIISILATIVYFILGIGFGLLCVRRGLSPKEETPYLILFWPFILAFICFYPKLVKEE